MAPNDKSRPQSRRTRRKPAPAAPAEEMRLQKFLSQAGVASRRESEEMIKAGRVAVDGRTVRELGVKVPADTTRVTVDGRPVELREGYVYILMNKPRETICTAKDPENRERVFDLIRERLPRVWTIGRLDYLTSGTLLITNDGDLTAALAHPTRQVERVYHVKLRDELTPKAQDMLAEGVELDDGTMAEPVKAALVDGDKRAWWYRLILHEGRYREVRRMLSAPGVDATVQKLHRAAFAGLNVDNVRPAHYIYLDRETIAHLYGVAGLQMKRNHPMLKVRTRKPRPTKPGKPGKRR